MNDLLKRANEIKDELVAVRRKIHQNAEVALTLPNTVATVVEKLKEWGYEPQVVEPSGVIAMVGQGDKTFMMRADMDALSQDEKSGLPFAATNGACHSCGHDCHTTMLLGAAKLLKERESELGAKIKLFFQPGEEGADGARHMIKAGIMENPKVDAAMALHVSAGKDTATRKSAVGTLKVGYGKMLQSSDSFDITIKGVGAHGATAFHGVDTITTAARVVLALQNIISMEVYCLEPSVITCGILRSGSANNILPEEAFISGTIRAFTPENREFLKKRLIEVTEGICKTFRATCEITFPFGTPPLMCDKPLAEQLMPYMCEIVGEDKVHKAGMEPGSEDFAYVADLVPSIFVDIGAGNEDDGCIYSLHDPRVIISEDVLPVGAAVYANCAMGWAKNNK